MKARNHSVEQQLLDQFKGHQFSEVKREIERNWQDYDLPRSTKVFEKSNAILTGFLGHLDHPHQVEAIVVEESKFLGDPIADISVYVNDDQ